MSAPSPASVAVDLAALRAAYLAALLEGNRRSALDLVIARGLDDGAPAEQLRCEVVQAAQREIGQLWQQNRISIAQEHQATAISQIVLAHLYDRSPSTPANGSKVIVACVPGELHDFPARLVADALDLAGFTTKYLGANVPTESLIERVCAERPDLLALSVTMAFNLPALRTCVERVRKACSVPIAVGGAACSWDEHAAETVAADLHASSADELVHKARVFLGVRA